MQPQKLSLSANWYQSCANDNDNDNGNNKEDVMEIHIVDNMGLWTSSESKSVAQLMEKIENLKKLSQNVSLPDQGQKLHDRIQRLEGELSRAKANEGDMNPNAKKLSVSESRNCFSVLSSTSNQKSPVLSVAQRNAKKVTSNDKDIKGCAFNDELSYFKSNTPASASNKHHFNEQTGSENKFSTFQDSPTMPFNQIKNEEKPLISSNQISMRNSNSSISSDSRVLDEEKGYSLSNRKRVAGMPCSIKPSSKKVTTSPLESSSKIKVINVEDDEEEKPKEQRVTRVSTRRKDVKIYYPDGNHPEVVELYLSDMDCLKPCQYLSSAIINFYIQYLKMVKITREQANDYLFLNTFFYSKLDETLDPQFRVDNGEPLAKIRRWLKGINIFKKSYILMPVHACQHWSLAIISIPAKEEESGPIVLHLDSLGIHSSKIIFDKIRSCLKAEWEYYTQTSTEVPISEKIWKDLPRNINVKSIQVPQQQNEYDCGLFVLLFMERFILEAPRRLSRTDIDRFGRKWFHPSEASSLRTSIKSLLEKQFKKANHFCSSTDVTERPPVTFEDVE